MFPFPSYYFVFILILQGICAFHCIRKGRQTGWLFFIIFLPLVGCLIYFFTQIISDREIKNVQSGVITTFNPSGKIKKLEKNLRFSDTFNNKVMLADAYLAAGQTEKAIGLYESSLVGNFDENEYVLTQLIIAYHNAKKFDKIIPIGKKIYHLPQFPRSKAHVYYTMALENTGNITAADNEFKKMRSKYSNFEFRYQYALFMIRNNRRDEALQLLSEINEESVHLSSQEKRYNREWIVKAKEELRKIRVKV
ncbi:MAG: PLDc N-terminal domain-containing protein [Flavisolibacter sp.]